MNIYHIGTTEARITKEDLADFARVYGFKFELALGFLQKNGFANMGAVKFRAETNEVKTTSPGWEHSEISQLVKQSPQELI